MNVGELIEQLQKLDPSMEVVLQRDPEGNGYSPLEGADSDVVALSVGREWDIYDTKWSADDAGMEEDEWVCILKGPRCVVLYPRY